MPFGMESEINLRNYDKRKTTFKAITSELDTAM
jgi:hypothetical protein